MTAAPEVPKRYAYKATVEVTRVELAPQGEETTAEPERLVLTGYEQQADSFEEALPKLEENLNHQWLKMRELSPIIEDEGDTQ